ncbi:N-acetyltransferase [Bacillus sp. AFS076308]|uniref:GNAT family N-acetyltransferase n=1 Tax=unclassified Bacillus (in: firmicutes) TaxID=185979 RepID=UPI000BF92D90|nr:MULTISPECIES: GNAT family N-acetyltransferase [unclassified Bacillus (in: firmicutes)]PFN97758.1 N-acetyltransferase [Bacillus sp. AFS076308]PGV51094.1 N-acetyltransferase [Bacillus sp. AFS037270]
MYEDFTLRDAEKKDMPIIVDIYNSTIPGRMVTADLEPVSVESRLQWFYDHSPVFRPLWVVETNGEICAWVSFQSFYGRPAYNATAEVSIYIHHNFRGKKLGKFLIQKAIDTCPELGIKTLLGFIFGHNEPSIKLFTSFGFEKWAHLPDVAELDGVERDLLILGKRVY